MIAAYTHYALNTATLTAILSGCFAAWMHGALVPAACVAGLVVGFVAIWGD